MIRASDILTDADVAKLAHLSLCTFQRRMQKGFKPGEIDFTQARPMRNGDRRFWLREDVEKVIRDRVTKGGQRA
jgi:hypothetical protein